MPPKTLVASRLAEAGWTVLARNVHVGRHELDLVAIDPGPPAALVVIEVRWRAGRGFGLPEETVDHRKRARVRARRTGSSTAGHCLTDRPFRDCRCGSISSSSSLKAGSDTTATPCRLGAGGMQEPEWDATPEIGKFARIPTLRATRSSCGSRPPRLAERVWNRTRDRDLGKGLDRPRTRPVLHSRPVRGLTPSHQNETPAPHGVEHTRGPFRPGRCRQGPRPSGPRRRESAEE